MSILIKGMEMPTSCMLCPFCVEEADPANGEMCMVTGKLMPPCTRERLDNCPLVPIPEHSGLFDVGQFEKGCFYGYGHDGKVYKLLWDIKVFDGAKKFYINPIIPTDTAEEGKT